VGTYLFEPLRQRSSPLTLTTVVVPLRVPHACGRLADQVVARFGGPHPSLVRALADDLEAPPRPSVHPQLRSRRLPARRFEADQLSGRCAFVLDHADASFSWRWYDDGLVVGFSRSAKSGNLES